MSNPMEQFNIRPIVPLEAGGYDISFTNSSLFMVLAVAVCSLLFALCLRKRDVIPGRAQAFVEMIYDFIHKRF